jgi:hypothetical protein
MTDFRNILATLTTSWENKKSRRGKGQCTFYRSAIIICSLPPQDVAHRFAIQMGYIMIIATKFGLSTGNECRIDSHVSAMGREGR